MPKHGAQTKQGYEVNLIIFTIIHTVYVKSMLSTPAGGVFTQIKNK